MYGFCYDMVVPKNSSFLRAYCPAVDFRIVLFVGGLHRFYTVPSCPERRLAGVLANQILRLFRKARKRKEKKSDTTTSLVNTFTTKHLTCRQYFAQR